MSIKSQKANMKALAKFLSNDLGYIYGERENGPNGAKKQFLSKGRAFMSALGKDLGFAAMRVSVNKSGIACSGDITLKGMWSDTDGLYVCLEQPTIGSNCIWYRRINNLDNSVQNPNHFMPLSALESEDYEALLGKLLLMKEEFDCAAA